MMELLDLQTAVIDGNAKTAAVLTSAAIDEGIPPMQIVTEALVPAMHEVGERFKRDEYFVPEMLVAARAMKTALGLIKPLLVEQGAPSGPRVAVGTVQGDLHDIGKNLVAMMLEGAGYDVIDLGSNVAPEQFIQAITERDAQVVALSALLTTTMPGMRTTIEALSKAGVRDRVAVVVGGAPVTDRFAEQIGADGFAPDAASAVDVVQDVLARRARQTG